MNPNNKYIPSSVTHKSEQIPARSYSNLFNSRSGSGSGSSCSSNNSGKCTLTSGSPSTCSSSESCSCFSLCEPCCIPPVRPVIHLKEIVCKNKDAFSETFNSPFAMKTVQIPGWMAYSGMVLTFHSYYQEPIPESPIETFRIHLCDIRFYLEDNTIEVVEPQTFDPGYTQGRVIRRGRISLPPPAEEAYFTLDHLNVGCEVTFYGKTFFICGCDAFTRRFMNRLGYPVPGDMEPPQDQATLKRQEIVLTQFARKAGFNPEILKAEKFLNNKGKILRFWAYWDDRCSEDGMLRRFNVYYYLEDDTIAVKELLEPNSGIVPQPAFLCRSKVPKNPNKPYPLPGVKEEALRILNVLGKEDQCGETIGYSYITDRLCPGIVEEECYKDSDLAIGATLNIFGRCFILTDCDEFTKKYYRDKYGICDFTPLVLNEEQEYIPALVPPPHIGIGSEEDTLANWNKIEVSPPRKEELKYLLMDKDFVTFYARLYKTLHKVNSERRFLIKYFLVDGSIQIIEEEHPNSGFKKGTFLTRARFKKSKGHEGNGYQSVYFQPEDFFIGQIIEINGYTFQLTGADESSLSYMEQHRDFFPHSDICKILNKMREVFGPIESECILQMFSCKDTQKLGIMDFIDFRSLILDFSKCSISEHEIITLQRVYKVLPPAPGIDWETLQVVIQTALRRFNFDKTLFIKMEYSVRHYDPCRTGMIDREALRSVLRGAKLPVAKELINFLIERFPAGDDCNRVNYCDIIKFLNWEDNPVLSAKPTALACVMKFLEPKPPTNITCINYKAFLDDVCPNIKCSLPTICCTEEEIYKQNCKGIYPDESEQMIQIINSGAKLQSIPEIPEGDGDDCCQNWDGFY